MRRGYDRAAQRFDLGWRGVDLETPLERELDAFGRKPRRLRQALARELAQRARGIGNRSRGLDQARARVLRRDRAKSTSASPEQRFERKRAAARRRAGTTPVELDSAA